ncbi:arylsulfatase [Reichenbachiella sp. MALMAid0571]|uniref:arylsulfatase n=1 Tax=Reichenbachiella sp. MALMAid0571 TaxID=3143939 RepID=UPI0032DE42A5
MHIYRLILVLSVLIYSCSPQVEQTEKKVEDRPNVVLIMTDDQGYGDLGFYGNPHIKTPNIDALAKKSVRFERFFVSPVCAPTRSSLMTGRHSLRTGIHDTYNGGAIMAGSEVTIAEVLSEAGYATGMFGKWHLGDNYPSRPHDQGFQETLQHLGGGIGQPGDWPNFPKKDRSYFDPTLWKNGEMVETKGYCSDVFADAAVDFIGNHKNDPFFVYLAFNAPHNPLQLPDEYYDMYKDIDPSMGFENDSRPFPDMDESNKEIARKVYGMVTNIDDNVKKVMDQLEQLNLIDNTLVIFMTDNGPWGQRYRAGHRSNKGSVFQGGVKVPSFWSLPSKFEGNREVTVNTTHMDVMPTLAVLCGAKLPENLELDGKNLLPLIEGKTPEWKDREINLYWNRRYPVLYQNMTVVQGDYKLVGQNPESNSEAVFELFDLSKDPYEQKDLSASLPDKFSELKSNMDEWYKDIITSPNLVNQSGAIVNSKFENPTILSRNDAGGQEGVWYASTGVYGLWEVEFAEAGYYDLVFKFVEEVDASAGGLIKIQIGTVLHSAKVTDTNLKEYKMENLYIPKGKGQMIPQLVTGNWPDQKRIFPFLMEVHSKK